MFIFYLFFLLRFSEFNDEWSSTKLKYITKVVVGYVGTISKYYTNNNGVPLLSTKNITDNGIDLSEINYVTKEFHAKNKKSQIFSNDLLIARHGNSGSAFLIPETVSEAQALNVVIIKNSKNFDSYFMENYFETTKIKKYMASLKAGSVQGVVNTKDIEKISINLPSFNEQNKINSFLQLFDRKIQLLENQYQIYIDFKKYLMQQIFTQKLRFDKNCYYKNKKVKDNLIESKIEGSDNINRRLTVKLNLKGISVRESKTTEFEGATKQFIRKSGQFIYGKQNLHKGAFGIIPKELDGYLSSSDIPSFDFIGEINPKWFYYYFSRQSFYENLERLSTGTGSKRISPKDFLNIRIMIPDINEQNKIVSILNNIDKKINIISNQIVETNEFKKGLLQQMFV